MQIELPKPHAITEPMTFLGPSAAPPLEPGFTIGFFGGGRVTFSEAEAEQLYTEVRDWLILRKRLKHLPEIGV